MPDYTVINLKHVIDNEEELLDLLKEKMESFSCQKNDDVDDFIRNKAIEAARHCSSITYLVFYRKYLVGYFTLAVKYLRIDIPKLSKTQQKKLKGATIEKDVAHIAAYLLAQIGKNLVLPEDVSRKIEKNYLIKLAEEQIFDIQKKIGGKCFFLECEPDVKLLEYYRNNGFKEMSERTTKSDNPHQLRVMFKFI
ncbi:MAG: hypothetical protein IIT66_05560 [Acetobacter sp.]|nr:hypothetical protein [Acetobacter sp.]